MADERKLPEVWEYEAYERAQRFDALYSPQMRSWSPFFRSRALWHRYTALWRAALVERDDGQ